ncbi:hypothetical protein HDA40_000898 [Hamadaea flava]|uniref:Lipoprotein n=1 Tax=Hamadaea flava TaxID=1742688 RepID=A0ABV8LRI4_9ACTN|nr:hypothetical protein [Hamadaea flava]MCP2322391.1 hypothetical protein [Hamadaea flava]
MALAACTGPDTPPSAAPSALPTAAAFPDLAAYPGQIVALWTSESNGTETSFPPIADAAAQVRSPEGILAYTGVCLGGGRMTVEVVSTMGSGRGSLPVTCDGRGPGYLPTKALGTVDGGSFTFTRTTEGTVSRWAISVIAMYPASTRPS